MTEINKNVNQVYGSWANEEEEVQWLLYGKRRREPRPESMKLREGPLAKVVEIGKTAVQTEIAA